MYEEFKKDPQAWEVHGKYDCHSRSIIYIHLKTRRKIEVPNLHANQPVSARMSYAGFVRERYVRGLRYWEKSRDRPHSFTHIRQYKESLSKVDERIAEFCGVANQNAPSGIPNLF